MLSERRAPGPWLASLRLCVTAATAGGVNISVTGQLHAVLRTCASQHPGARRLTASRTNVTVPGQDRVTRLRDKSQYCSPGSGDQKSH
eukprot:7391503-Prymnesium_polylepis.1